MGNKDRDFLQRIQATFRIEAEEHLKSFSVYLNKLETEQSTESQAGNIEALFREVHSLKGSARSIGQTGIEAVCQELESLFSLLKKKVIEVVPEMLDLFYQSEAFLLHLISTGGIIQAPQEQEVINYRIKQIQRYVAGVKKEDHHHETVQVESNPVLSPETEPEAVLPKNTRMVIPEAVRIPISKLNPLLLQAEEFIQTKITFNQLTKELKQVLNEITDLKTESQKLKRRKAMLTSSQLKEWQVGNELRLSNLESIVTRISHSMERDGYSFELMVDDHLDAMKQVLLLPVSSLTESFPVMVREISRDQEKEIDLVIIGSDLEMDKRILEELKGPLIHLIRNSIDHGIGSAKEREMLNKPKRGKIVLSFTAKGGGLVEISITDDGKGIDLDQVLNVALKSGIVTKSEVEKLSRNEILDLIYHSGISTSAIITDLSGRGLGMSIVREKVEKLNGRLSLETTKNVVTTFKILLPMAMTTYRGIMVSLGEYLFFLPTKNVKMVLRVKPDEITTVENRDTIKFGDDILSVVCLADALGVRIPPKGGNASQRSDVPDKDYCRIVVLALADRRLAFKVDDVLEEQQVLVKGLGALLNRVRNISGATILGSGKIVPVLNIADLMKSGISTSVSRKITPVEATQVARTGRILVAEDSITSRTLLKNILETAGYQVTTAVDGLDGYTQAKNEDYDLIVSDVDMPRMNGFELTAKIKTDNKLSEIPVILVTALESKEDRERGIEVGADAYIIKSSFDQSNLLEVIKKLI